MKMGTKTVLVILITLIIGMIIGVLITGAFARHRIGRFMSMREPGCLGAHVEKIIDPDESQREAVRDILQRHSEQFLKIHSRFEGEMLALRDSLKKDLDPILTEEQKKRLERQPKPPKHFRDRRPGPWRQHEPGSSPPLPTKGGLHPPPPDRDEG
jgi:hypothetical protein